MKCCCTVQGHDVVERAGVGVVDVHWAQVLLPVTVTTYDYVGSEMVLLSVSVDLVVVVRSVMMMAMVVNSMV